MLFCWFHAASGHWVVLISDVLVKTWQTRIRIELVKDRCVARKAGEEYC